MAGARVMGSAAFGWVLFRFWAHRDILRRRTTLVANQSIAEVDGQPSNAEGDTFDPKLPRLASGIVSAVIR